MDWIRHEYQSEMRFFADDLSSTIPIQWYFVPENSLVMPFHTPFRSREDIREESLPLVLGEDVTTIKRRGGGLVAHGPGRTFCGNQRQWEEGCSVSDPIPPTNVFTGLPCCCGPAPLVMQGGGVGAGSNDGLDTNFLLQENLGRVLQENAGRVIWT